MELRLIMKVLPEEFGYGGRWGYHLPKILAKLEELGLENDSRIQNLRNRYDLPS
jgi:hypothetical protein